MLKKAFALAAALFLSACTQLSLFAVNVPVLIPKEQIHSDVIFDKKLNLKLDVYQPSSEKYTKPFKTIVFFYGGSWKSGAKEDYKFLAGEMIQNGYLVVIADYRKYPDVKFPDFVKDSANAVAWVAKNAQKYGGQNDEIIVMGHSAGAHTATLLAADRTYLKNAGVDPKIIKATIGLSGPYSFTPKAEDLKEIFGPPEKYPLMRVPNYIDGNEPPMLLLHGKKDKIVGAFNLERLKKAIIDKEGQVQTKYYNKLDHVGTVAAFSWVRRNKSTIVDDIYSYLKDLDQKPMANNS